MRMSLYPSLSKSANRALQLQSVYAMPARRPISLKLTSPFWVRPLLNCSEIGRLAGIAYTDWSWSALFADFDNDGYKDILIANGYPKAVNDLDYQTAVFRARRAGDDRRALRLLKELPGYDFSNYLFRNKGDLTFTDMTKQWGMDRRGFSYGAAYADLNNDGKLDLVINHIDAPASIYANVQPDDYVHHYLQIRLDGEPPNRWICT